jgi:tripartite-type tricarboxylate transporter receptor subunit TctC
MRTILYILLLTFASAMPVAAQSQAYPAKPIRLVNEFVAGSGGDTLLRVVVAGMTPLLGQPIIVENRAGGGGIVAAEVVMNAVPDGYTILGATPAVHVTRLFLAKTQPFDAQKSFTPLVPLSDPVFVLMANPSVQANNLKELIDLAKREPGKLSYATAGVGSNSHLVGEQIKMLAGVDIVHVPYKALAESVRDVMAGQIPLGYNLSAQAVPLVKAGKVKLIAVASNTRLPQWPDLGTVREILPAFEKPPGWTGLFGPANLPPAIARRIAGDAVRAMNQPEIAAKINEVGFTVIGGTPEEFAALIRRQIDLVGRIVKAAGIQAIE